ncbi:YchJ family protein [Polymorphum gilvum]|uniref:SEC-C motif domain protein n=1 Tax=Polymorphum gilvum (strain LMG 25793 / CGMCC 1.9160 / SL003B-26A1) TaxID=991905 RepID=F2J069_POLGS|nr:YchJ family metal-binding protein [Polymorphum gilvum]ADZ68604.1 SEC-C motif domain protein [Polymorphum gilvum SL003B-26A1]
MTPCPCGSGRDIELCCGPFLAGAARPETAEALMRSRYTAYVVGDIAYLKDTLWPKFQPAFDGLGTARWAAENRWTSLTVLAADRGEPGDREGTVLFEARYLSGAALHSHRELSLFRKKGGRWYYVEALDERRGPGLI